MKRRCFLSGAAAAAAWPVFARGQNSIPVVGYLHIRSERVSLYQAQAFLKGLQDFGFINGRNVSVEFRWAEGDLRRLPALALELAKLNCVAIATAGEQSVLATKAVAPDTPIVFAMSSDPIKLFGRQLQSTWPENHRNQHPDLGSKAAKKTKAPPLQPALGKKKTSKQRAKA